MPLVLCIDDLTAQAPRELSPYISLADRFALFPHSRVSTTVWDVEDDKRVGVLEGHTSNICTAKIGNIGTTAVTFGNLPGLSYQVKIWSLESMQCTANLSSAYEISALLKDRLLLGSQEGPIKVWDIGGSAPVDLMDLQGHDDAVGSIIASDTSNIVISGSSDTSVRLWDLRSGQCVRLLEGHTWAVTAVSMDMACRTAVTGSDDQTAKLWDLGSGRCINTYNTGSCHDIVMHKSGSYFLAAEWNFSLKAWTTSLESINQSPFLACDLGSLCDAGGDSSIATSNNLSVVGVCRPRSHGGGLKVLMWK